MKKRDFIKALFLSFLFGSGGKGEGSEKNVGGKGKIEEKNAEKKRKWGMVIDLDLCSGCGACVVACKTENNIPYSGNNEKMRSRGIMWITLLKIDGVPIPLPCLHCDNPPCTKVCPTGATYKNPEGIVAQIWDRCIGCRYCMVACPYSRKYFNWGEPKWEEIHIQTLNPDVATRPNGVVEKCTFCYHRIRKVKERAKDEGRDIKDEEVRYLPACAEACPAKAIVFGDLEDENSLVHQLSNSTRAFTLLPHLSAKPKVIYLAKEKRRLMEVKSGGIS